jgi:hypothetical protein
VPSLFQGTNLWLLGLVHDHEIATRSRVRQSNPHLVQLLVKVDSDSFVAQQSCSNKMLDLHDPAEDARIYPKRMVHSGGRFQIKSNPPPFKPEKSTVPSGANGAMEGSKGSESQSSPGIPSKAG